MCGALRQLLLQVTLIDAGEIVADELASVVRDQLFPKSPAQQRLKIDAQNYTTSCSGVSEPARMVLERPSNSRQE